jgi:cytochrome b6-f complex iron-sulfur subunit
MKLAFPHFLLVSRVESPEFEIFMDEGKKVNLPRRDFLSRSWRAIAALAVGQGAYTGLRFLASRRVEGAFGEIVTAGLVADFPAGTITPFDSERFLLVRFEDGGFLALSNRCTHLACTVGWNEQQQRFVCPCHGSEFQRDGNVIKPPAPRPLDRFAITIDTSERIQVDTRQSIRRTAASLDDLVYAVDTHDNVNNDREMRR